MYRRAVSLLLLPTVLLTQWASAGACFGCQHTTAQHRLPHFHLASLAFWHSGPTETKTKKHCSCGNHHHQADEQAQGGNPAPSDDADHHDEDAIYLPTALIHGMRSERSSADTVELWAAPLLNLCQAVSTASQPSMCTHHPPPDLSAAGCPLYLRLATLLL